MQSTMQHEQRHVLRTRVIAFGYHYTNPEPWCHDHTHSRYYVCEAQGYYCSTGHIYDVKLSSGSFLGIFRGTIQSISCDNDTYRPVPGFPEGEGGGTMGAISCRAAKEGGAKGEFPLPHTTRKHKEHILLLMLTHRQNIVT